jgi:hypothetical protein
MAMRTRFLVTALLVLVAAFALAPTPNAETGKKALILGTSVTGGAASREAVRATALGFTVTVVDDSTWASMTAGQFADYQLVIVGDPTCGLLPQVVSQNAVALADAVMARGGGSVNTMAGNRLLIGTDPVFHFSQGGNKLIDAGIDFAGVQEGATGLYLDFTCRDIDYDSNGVPDGQDKLLPLLTIATPNWTQDQSPPCGGDVSLISNAAQFSSLHSSDLRGWSCSVHESFPTFPTDWSPLAIATDTASHPTCGNDVDTGTAECGEAYLLVAGSGIVSTAPNLSLSPTTATNPVGTPHTVTATVTKPDGSPAGGVHVTFVVTGANAGATGVCNPPTCDSNASGHVTFTYTGTNTGNDTIHASITVSGSTQTATAQKTWTSATGDLTPPICTLVATVPGPPKAIQVEVQDTGSGLATIAHAETNAVTAVSPFVPGDTNPILVNSTKVNQALASTLKLTVTDVAGNVTVCDPVVPGVKHRAHYHAGRHRPAAREILRLARLRR